MTQKFDITVLKTICNAKIDDFRVLGQVNDTPDGINIFIDNGAKVLAVAHLDTVCRPKHFNYNKKTKRVYSPTLDDRLGATIILDVLPRLLGNSAFDVLLTEGEEIGWSTAAHFESEKQYNWMFSFDRGGVDAVHYQYDSPKWKVALDGLAMHKQYGMFSDLSFLGHMGASGINVGCAYYDYHSPRAYANLNETAAQVNKFVKFFRAEQSNYYPHVELLEVSAQESMAYGSVGKDDDGYGYKYNCERGDYDYTWEKPNKHRKNTYDWCDYCGQTCDEELTKLSGGHLVCFTCVEELLKEWGDRQPADGKDDEIIWNNN